jgi:hypothetical protein
MYSFIISTSSNPTPVIVTGNCSTIQTRLWQVIPLIILAGFLLYLLASMEMGFFGTIGFIITLVIELNLLSILIRTVLNGC